MIYFITSNKGKFEEAKKIVPELEMLEMDLPEEQEVDQQKIVQKKLALVADYLCSSAGKTRLGQNDRVAFIVEDTGFYLDCLPGLPGPLVKWFLKSIGKRGLYEICKRFENFKAKGVSIIGLRTAGGEIKFFKGEIEGKVVLERGEDGFGWDPVFVPDGYNVTFAEMSRQEKNEISMRRKAFEELGQFLSDNS